MPWYPFPSQSHRLRSAGGSLLLLGLAALCWGCDRPARIDVDPPELLLTEKDQSAQLVATVRDERGKPLPKAQVTFRSLTPTMASVDDSGVVRAITSGTATILVTAGEISRNVDVLIQIPKKIIIRPAEESQFQQDYLLMVGITKGYKASVITDRGDQMIAGDIRWSSSDPTIFTVDQQGNVKTLKEGEADLVAFAAGIQGARKIQVKHEELQEDGTLSQ